MWFWPGTKLMVNLTDGTVLSGVARFTWRPWNTIVLGDPMSHDVRGNTSMGGGVVVPRHAVSFVQTGV